MHQTPSDRPKARIRGAPHPALLGVGFVALAALLFVPFAPGLLGAGEEEDAAPSLADQDVPAVRPESTGGGARAAAPDSDLEGPGAEEAMAADVRAREDDDFEGGNGSTERFLEITPEASGARSWGPFDGNPTKVFDLDGDGDKEIIAQNDDHGVYIFDSRNGRLLAELRADVPEYWEARSFNGPEAAILAPGGAAHVVTANSAAVLSVYRFEAMNSTARSFDFTERWSVRLDECHEEPGMDARTVLHDLDYDGDLEIIAATEEMGVYAFHHNGTLMWANCMSGGNAAPAVGDVTGDGWPDVVHVSDGGIVSALNGQTGEWIWTYDVADDFELGAGSMTVSPALGDLTGDTVPEIVVGVRDSHDAQDWDENHAMLLALNGTGEPLWAYQHPTGNPLTYTRPIVADADGDGENEVYWADWNTVGHNPPSPKSEEAWNRTGPAQFYRLDAAGDLVWNRTLETWWNNKDIPIADLTGDGRPELLANGPDPEGKDGIWYLDVETGAKVAWVGLAPWKAQRGPVIADLWGTNTTQWVIQVAPDAPKTDHGILVYDTGAPYAPVWPHPPAPTLDDTFDVRFDEPEGNEHWVGMRAVQSGARIETMELRSETMDWQPMASEGWGWSYSGPVPDGSVLMFRATSTGGEAVESGCYSWTDGARVSCPPALRAGG